MEARLESKSIYVAHSGTAGTVLLRDGGATGTVRCTINTAAAIGEYQTIIPEPGIRCTSSSGPYIAITGGVSFVTVFLRLINYTIKGRP